MAASFKYDDFTPVTSRKKKKKNLKARPPLLTLVQSAAEDLRRDNWNAICQRLLQDHLDTLPVRPSKIICLGLGSPSSSANSRAQLAFLLEVCKSTGIEHAQVALYDPVFSEEDKALFGQLGLTDKQDGRHPLDAPTILWMPHCDLDLYESVLATNWSHDQLTYMTLIANRLGDYVESYPRGKLETRAPRLLRIADFVKYTPLPPCSAWTTAFTTIGIQYVAEVGDWVIGQLLRNASHDDP